VLNTAGFVEVTGLPGLVCGTPSTFQTTVLLIDASDGLIVTVKFTVKYWQMVVGPPAASAMVIVGGATKGFIVMTFVLAGPETPQELTPTTLIVYVGGLGTFPQFTVIVPVPCPVKEAEPGTVHV